jgi:23S rRNA pseudouridine1911/1915/1917 synthase
VRKDYLAVVRGSPDPPAGRIVAPLGRDTADRRRVVVRDDGQYCETQYEVVAHPSPRSSLVRCTLVTGRTHQIRVHLASRGWPIVGDQIYGVADTAIGRQALHAWKVSLPHPATRQMMMLEASIPRDMRTIIE